MLEVHMDRIMGIAFVNTFVKAKNEPDLSKRIRLMKIESFIKQASKLKLDNTFKEFNKQLLPFFTQGVGKHGSISFDIIDEKSIKKNKCAVALLDKGNPIFLKVSKENLTIPKEKLQEDLASLMFNAQNQATSFQIIPENVKPKNVSAPNLISLNGWNTFIKYPLVPMTDIIIIDPYFLLPEGFKDTYDDYVIEDYILYSLLPLLKVLNKYAINKHLTVNIFTEGCNEVGRNESIASVLFTSLDQAIKDNDLNIDLLLIVAKNLNQHKRILYTNYFALKTELSFHHFHANKVTGNKKDEALIKPFAVDDPRTDNHSAMMNDLADLYNKFNDNRSIVIDNRNNLSEMILQAHYQINLSKQ